MANRAASQDITTMYRIGDFAKYLGVTPDFLKHYENIGIIHSVQGDNGYRYYRFQEAIQIFDCIRLKNLGFTIKESRQILQDMEENEIFDVCRDNIDRIRKEIKYKQVLVNSFADFEDEMSFLQNKDSDWSIENTEKMLFLPHTNARDFLDNPKIYEILPEWINSLPIVRPAFLVEPENPENREIHTSKIKRIWGFAVPKTYAQILDIPVNSAVIEIPKCKALHYKFSARIVPEGDKPSNYFAVWDKLNEMNIKPEGKILCLNNLSAHINGQFTANQHYIVPIELSE